MKENGHMRKGNFKGLVPLLAFLVIYFVVGLISSDFSAMPLLIGIVIASGIALAMNPGEEYDGKKLSFAEKVELYCKGGGESTLIMMVIIFILAGAFYGVAQNMGAVDSVTNIGLSLLPSNMILPGIFIIGCILSFSMGTSMGTVAALSPIAIDIALKTNTSLPLVCGVVVGGAMFGDNLSFISDTCIAATRTQNVSMKDKFKYNIIVLAPAILINLILLFFNPIDGSSIELASYSYNLVNIIPYVVVIVLSLVGMNVMSVLSIGVISGVVIGVLHGDFTLIESFKIVHTGMTWMEDVAIIAVFVGGLVELMKYLGGIDWLLNVMSKNTKTRAGGELVIAILVILLGFATTNNTIAVVASGPLARDIGKKFSIPRVKVATILSIACCCTQGLLPHAGQLLVAGGLAQISPMSIIPFVWYNYLMTIFLVLFIVFDFPKIKFSENEYDEFELSEN